MIAIIADDLSGAAELAGIAAARGWRAEVQTRFDPSSEAEVIAIDTNTRLKSETEAARIVGGVARAVAAARPSWIFKKTDSVLRGHIRAEIAAVLAATGLRDCVFIPANPSKSRVIRGGRYFIAGVPLDETAFARDPWHPRRSSVVREWFGEAPAIHTPDAEKPGDLDLELRPETLAAGAADFFAARLTRSDPSRATERVRRFAAPKTLVVCGSLAALEAGRASELSRRGFVIRTIADAEGGQIWGKTDKLLLVPGAAASSEGAPLTEALAAAALPLVDGRADLRIGLEGGATALAFIARHGWTRFAVAPEGFTGVGSLRPPGGPLLCVKPGSYPWPGEMF
ncbi:MAG: four-carbon acid sugar kinase family protein [Verrucomicrobia bacterium]|nr:four-carbon acid sugar kinase family protein [Verrucomicrobiota bacterium]